MEVQDVPAAVGQAPGEQVEIQGGRVELALPIEPR